VALLLRAGADANAATLSGDTPLHSSPGQDIFELLLRAGARPNARDMFGRTPLHVAAMYGDTGKWRDFRDAGADLEAKSENGETPLLTAVKCREYSVGVGALPADLARRWGVWLMLKRAELASQLQPLMVAAVAAPWAPAAGFARASSAAARRPLFDERLFDAALWRVVARFVSPLPLMRVHRHE
jgi:hypothetical protein